MDRILLEHAVAGDIVSIAGFSAATVTCTICDPEVTQPLPVRFHSSLVDCISRLPLIPLCFQSLSLATPLCWLEKREPKLLSQVGI
jgi:hypothetical protein